MTSGEDTEMGFWDKERCEYCKGPIVERRVALPRKSGHRYVLIENVPAGVCKRCGTRYYAGNILKSVDALIRRRQKPKRLLPMAVYSL
jgi:YgiT-type zinc finger domain-containing protein